MLAHKSHSSAGEETIILIHGGFSSGKEWDGVWPLLTNHGYHVLIPDLPGHGDSLDVHPFEINDAARRLAGLIEEKAHGQVAHVVSISIGAHVAAALAAQYPDRLRSLVVSGFNLFAPNLLSYILPPLVYIMQRGSGFAQSPSAEWTRFWRGQGSFSTTRDVLNLLFSSRELGPLSVRTLVVAATRAGVSADHVDHSRRLFETVASANGSQLVQHRGMRHPWNFEAPSAFAEMVRCWVSGAALPGEFEAIV